MSGPPADPARLERVLRALAADVLVLDAEGRVRYVLPETAERLGAAPAALVGRPLRDLCPPDERAACAALLREAAAAGGGATPGRLVLAGEGGARVLLPVVVSPAPGAPEETLLLGAPGLAELAVAERARRDRTRELDALFRLGAAIDAAETVQELLPQLPDLLRPAFQYPERLRAAVRYRDRAYGDPAAFDAQTALSFPIVVARQERGVVRVAYDEPLPFLAEERSLLRLVERLLRKGIERHEFERGVLQAEKLAALGRLVAGFAHEVNNPAQFLRGNLEILREALNDMVPLVERCLDRDPELAGARVARLEFPYLRQQLGPLLDDMFGATERIRDLAADLKRFARGDVGHAEVAVALPDVVDAALRVARGALRGGVRVETAIAGDLPPVAGNRRQLEQVVVNVLENAAEALRGPAGTGRGTVTVRAERGGEPAQVVLVVADDGPGMTAAVRERIFEPFFTTKHAQGGTGLGLSIAWGIVRAHGGTILVDSAPGRGTALRIVLPVSGAAGSAASPPPDPASSPK